MTPFDELKVRKLGTPKGIKKFIFNNTDYKTNKTTRNRYVNVIEVYKGKLLLRTFAYHNKNKSTWYEDIEYQEVCRRLQGESKVLLCNIENNMCGRCVLYGNHGWCDDKYYGWVWGASNKHWYFEGYDMYDKQEIIDMLNIPYCQYFSENNKSNLWFFDYICTYLDEPRIELLVKADLSQFVRYTKKLRLNEKSLDKVFRLNNYWIKYLTKLSYSDLALIRGQNHKIHTYEDLVKVREIMEMFYNCRDYKYIRRYARPCMLDFIKSIKDLDKSNYEDYLRMNVENQIEITNSVIVYKNWMKKHDELFKLSKIKKDKDTYERMFSAYRRLIKYVFSENNLVIIPCEKVSELEFESNKLNHCVSTYANKYMNQETNIMFIRNVNNVEKPYVTLEFKGKRVIQCRGYNNNVDYPLDIKVKEFVNDWCKKFKFKSCFSS